MQTLKTLDLAPMKAMIEPMNISKQITKPATAILTSTPKFDPSFRMFPSIGPTWLWTQNTLVKARMQTVDMMIEATNKNTQINP